jgi:membrane fusion protein, copper/silver efflux system
MLSPDPSQTFRGRFFFALRFFWVRLRFVLAVAGLFAVIGLWQQLGALWDRAVLWTSGQTTADRGVSPDTEYFCPMCPGVLSAWPEKCPVCKMPLVRRTRGASQLLPEGVTARMQISPHRVQLAGIKTSPVGYLPLSHEIRTTGRLDSSHVIAPISPWDIPFALSDTPVELRSASLPAGMSLAGKIESVTAGECGAGEMRIGIRNPPPKLLAGAPLQVICRVPLASVVPYRLQPRDIPPLSTGDSKAYFVCPDHPAWIRTVAGKCPFDDRDLEERRVRDDQRLAWSCRFHEQIRSANKHTRCEHCQRECRSLRVVTYAPAGEVLVVPESAVIDTGALKLVFVESMPGMFDGVVVELGTKEAGYYPVLSGLEPGQRIASAGAFLLDAETRLNPSLAASYFGAGSASAGGSSAILAGSSPAASAPDLLATLKLDADDLFLARRQKSCPITRMPLGSMGELVPIEVDGERVFLCCEACRDSVRTVRPAP